jgi:hypothetical protein
MLITKNRQFFCNSKQWYSLFAVLLVFCSVFAFAGTEIQSAYAETVPQIVSYQGVLKEAGEPIADGEHDVIFRIYDSETGGTVLWTGTHTVANGNPVSTEGGVFSVLLGSGDGNNLPDDLFTNPQTFLGVTVGSDTEMVPRQQTGAAPYALNAKKIDGVGLATTTFALGDLLYVNADGELDRLSVGSAGTLLGIDSGVPGWVSTTSLGIVASQWSTNGSSVSYSAGNVGIGTTTPGAMLAVAGSGLFGARVTGSEFVATSTTGTSTFAGRVGIGTTSPGALFAVQGNSWITGSLRIGTTTNSPVIVGDVSGNARGFSSVDIQSSRNTSTQIASGQNTVAIGSANTASGAYTTAVGSSNTVSGLFSTAIGYSNSASQTYSVALGGGNGAMGVYATAVGLGNSSSGMFGTTIGYGNTAYEGSFAAGVQSVAQTRSVAIGYSAEANVSNGVAIGYDSDVTYANSIAIGHSNKVNQFESIVVGNNNTLPITGNVSYAVSDKNSIFGFANLIYTDIGQSSNYVAVHGNDNTVYGKTAVVMGSSNVIGSDDRTSRVAIGSSNSVFGNNSVAIGSNNQLGSGATSNTLVGNNNNGGSNVETHIFGAANTVTNSYVNIFGYNNYVIGYGSQVFGTSNSASASYSMAVGRSNNAQGVYSGSVGYNNVTMGDSTNAFGFSNTASNTFASAFGYSNDATGINSTAFGFDNSASGLNSVAFGNHVLASASGTTAIGFNFTNSITNSLMIGPNRLAAATILSTGEFQSPFFTATSTTGTSTFAGRVGIGTLRPRSALHVTQASTSEIAYMVNTNSGTDADVLALGVGASVAGANNLYLGFFDSSTENGLGDRVGYISGNGSGGVSFTQTSDRRLKEEVVDTAMGLSDLLGIKVRDYNLKTVSGATVQGFIAQELYEVYPYAVVATDDGERDLFGSDVPWGVDYGRLTPLLVKSIQDQQMLIGDFANMDGQTILDMKDGLFVGDAFATVLARFDEGIDTVANFVAVHVTAAYGTFGKLFADEVTTDKLCVRKADGSKVCFTGEELEEAIGGTTISGGSETPVTDGNGNQLVGGNDAPIETVPGEENPSVDSGDTPETQTNDPVSTESDTESSSSVSSDSSASDSNVTVSDAE